MNVTMNAAVCSYTLMLRCWDAEPAHRPLFCELSYSVANIIAKMKAAAAAAATGGDDRDAGEDSSPAEAEPHGYVNTANTAVPVAAAGEYLRPLTDRNTPHPPGQDCGIQSQLLSSATSADDVNDDDSDENFISDDHRSDSVAGAHHIHTAVDIL